MKPSPREVVTFNTFPACWWMKNRNRWHLQGHPGNKPGVRYSSAFKSQQGDVSRRRGAHSKAWGSPKRWKGWVCLWTSKLNFKNTVWLHQAHLRAVIMPWCNHWVLEWKGKWDGLKTMREELKTQYYVQNESWRLLPFGPETVWPVPMQIPRCGARGDWEPPPIADGPLSPGHPSFHLLPLLSSISACRPFFSLSDLFAHLSSPFSPLISRLVSQLSLTNNFNSDIFLGTQEIYLLLLFCIYIWITVWWWNYFLKKKNRTKGRI